MEAALVWIADHAGLVLVTVFLFLLLLVAHAGLAVERALIDLRRLPRRWFPLVAALVWFVVCGVGLYSVGSYLIRLGPGLLAQMNLIDEPAPDLTYFRVEDGTPGRLAEYRGKVVLVNFWGTWCPPCREELPALDRLHSTYADQGLVVLQISEEARATLVDFLAASPMSTEHGQLSPIPWPDTGTPTSFLIDRRGIVRQVLRGGRTYEELERAVRPYL